MIRLDTITLPCDLSAYSEIIDVRSPKEFALDHLPNAINLPVLNDAERDQVGTLYKQNPFEARKLGAAFVSHNISQHLAHALNEKHIDYTPLLYCWRGGMRSRSMAIILQSIGWKPRLLQGGYRGFRQFVVHELSEFFSHPTIQLKAIAGLTGVAKTRLLQAIQKQGNQIIDLEALANHRGSLLGASPESDQPSQKQFETKLWSTVAKLDHSQPIYVEAESNRIGNLHCPAPLWAALNRAQVIQIHLEIDARISLLCEEYKHFLQDPKLLAKLLESLQKIRGQQQIDQWKELIDTKQWSAFVRSILTNHYDLSYRQPGEEKSNYQAPSNVLHLKSASTDAIEEAAKKISL